MGLTFPILNITTLVFTCAGFNPGPHTAFSFHFSLVSFNLQPSVSFSLFVCFFFLVSLTFLKCVCLLFYRMFLILGVSECLIMTWL